MLHENLFVFLKFCEILDLILKDSIVWYFKVSVQYVDDQEAISEDTFEDNNILISPTVKVMRRGLGSRLPLMN